MFRFQWLALRAWFAGAGPAPPAASPLDGAIRDAILTKLAMGWTRDGLGVPYRRLALEPAWRARAKSVLEGMRDRGEVTFALPLSDDTVIRAAVIDLAAAEADERPPYGVDSGWLVVASSDATRRNLSPDEQAETPAPLPVQPAPSHRRRRVIE